MVTAININNFLVVKIVVSGHKERRVKGAGWGGDMYGAVQYSTVHIPGSGGSYLLRIVSCGGEIINTFTVWKY